MKKAFDLSNNKLFFSVVFIFSLQASAQESLWSDYQKILDMIVIQVDYQTSEGQFFHNGIDTKKLFSNSSAHALINSQEAKLKTKTAPTAKNEALAFWINAYNFFTIVDVKNHPEIDSMKDLGWKNKRFVIGRKKYDLDTIEHKIIRPLKEPRIHFVINCASVGCPALDKKIFLAETLEIQLTKATQNALINPLHARIEKLFWHGEVLNVTSLFKWFGEDFTVHPYGSISGFISHYGTGVVKKRAADSKPKISYNWDLYSIENIKAQMNELAKEYPHLKLRAISQAS